MTAVRATNDDVYNVVMTTARGRLCRGHGKGFAGRHEATLEKASASAKAGGPSGALKVVLVVAIVVVMVVVLAIVTAHFPDLDFEGR